MVQTSANSSASSKVRLSCVPGTKTVIHEYNVHAQILSTGMAVDNPHHLELLRALGQDVGPWSG